MITKEKHFTKCETPNSSRIIEDKKHSMRLTNGLIDPNKTLKQPNEIPKPEKIEENNKSSPEPKLNEITEDKTDSDDANASYNGPKYGTVIPNRIFVGGFSAKTADEELWRFFSSFSHITAAKIIYDRAGVSKCYGFVTFANPKDAKAIVKQYGGVMFSPMGRLRIAQAVRKQIPQFSPDLSPVMPPEQYYLPPQCPPKGPLCIAAYPIPPGGIAMPPQHLMNKHPPPQPTMMNHQPSPHGSTTATPESVGGHAHHPAQSQIPQIPQQQQTLPTQQHQQSHQQQQQQSPAIARFPTVTAAGVAQSGGLVRPPSAAQPMYPPGGMVPQYMIPAVAYPQTLPTYDATGLYTTCPGYAQPMPAAYPYVVLQPAPRDGYAAYHGALAPTLAYGHPQPTACYVPDAKMPVMNSYIY